MNRSMRDRPSEGGDQWRAQGDDGAVAWGIHLVSISKVGIQLNVILHNYGGGLN